MKIIAALLSILILLLSGIMTIGTLFALSVLNKIQEGGTSGKEDSL